MATLDDSSSLSTMIDEIYEFSAPRFFDFLNGESEDEAHEAELWFESAIAYAPSPFMPRIKTGRSAQVEALCDFSEGDQMQKMASEIKPHAELVPADIKEDNEAKDDNNTNIVNVESADKEETCKANKVEDYSYTQENESVLAGKVSTMNELANDKESNDKSTVQGETEACTPKPSTTSQTGDLLTNSKKHQTARKIASLVRNPSALKPKSQLHPSALKPKNQCESSQGLSALKQKNQSQSLQANGAKLPAVNKNANVKNVVGTPNLAQENQAIKRQKLDGGRSRQILNVKPQNLPHKSKLGITGGSLCSSAANKTSKADRKLYVREPAAPFISMAEMMKKFQSSTRDLSLPHINSSLTHTKPKLTLTRPKEPEFETAQRIRSVRVKSSAELEEEMMAKIPKFKARPVNKKILEASTLPALPRTAPQPPEFQEFHLETMARANQNAESTSIASTEISHQNNQWKPHLTEPKIPVLHTSLRARPPRVKSSFELEQEELEKAPKFKARPLNKKIFESKGELGIFSNAKKHITVPQEFHFATNDRIPPPAAVVDLFDKLSLNSEPHHENHIPRNTRPNPFHLQTEERGAEKEKKFVIEVVQKQLEEERARVPKANPYPYATDYPVIPPKPEPKQCTKPEPFQLESVVRHEEEMRREMEERQRLEREEAQMRLFKAQPILKEDPLPVPEKARKPLTEVQEFNLHADDRAVDRAEFDQKIKEKEMMYKRYREESEAAKMMEEEKALKHLRRTMVPHARPVPKFDNPFCPRRSSKETTKPKSPILRVTQRKERKKYFGVVAAASSAAAHMR